MTKVEIDYLTEDKPIHGQEWGVYSFLSPENIEGCAIRAFKNRGNFATCEEASSHAEFLRNTEPAFNVFVGENFKWTVFNPDPELIKDNNYYEPKLQELMKGNLMNQEKAKQFESQRKKDMIEEAIKEEMNKKTDRKNVVRDRLKNKLLNRNNNTSGNTSMEQQSKTTQQNTTTTETISSINENLQKLKQTYAELMSKKEQSKSQ